MKLSEIFSNLSKDWQLISMTKSAKLTPEVKQGLVELGWKQQEVKKVACYASIYHVVAITYDASAFLLPSHKEGDNKWYNDLAGLAIPNHKPGILTKIIG